MKIVVTGSRSFIGAALLARLRRRGIEWFGLDALPAAGPNQVQADIRAPDLADALPDADAVVHLAAISRDQDCRRDPATAFAVNVGGTLNLMEVARRRRISQFVFASSEWVYGSVGNGERQTEQTPIDAGRIDSEYALTKIAGERLLAMAGAFAASTVLRFGIVYGPRPANWSAVESLFHAVERGAAVEVKGSLATARRFIHVDDIAAGIIASLGGRNGFEIFNLCGNELVTLGEVIETSARLLERNPVVVEGDPHAVSIRNPDNSKARAQLQWTPRIDLAEGLASLREAAVCLP